MSRPAAGGMQVVPYCLFIYFILHVLLYGIIEYKLLPPRPPQTHTQRWRKWAHDFYDEDRTQYFMGVWIIASYAASIVDAQMMNPVGSELEQTANKGRSFEK